MLQISQKTFLVGGFLVFFLASAVLFTLHGRALDPNTTGDWWAVRFVSPNDDQNLNFEVENYTDSTTGTYKILVNGTVQEEKDFIVEKNAITSVTPETSVQNTSRTHILVKLGNKEQSLTR
ncbi:MAG: hypothetical protein E6P95_03715 [Candidatus Moraniibacteriota bacterium]|nr:MAG: hypothetical protein E6P95_03715 [Candidatus Moranbacteria bacterium]